MGTIRTSPGLGRATRAADLAFVATDRVQVAVGSGAVNGDGRDDVMVGDHDTPALHVHLVQGADRGSLTTLVRRTASARVPRGTRAITVTVATEDGAALADNVGLTVAGTPTDTPGGTPGAGRPGGGSGGGVAGRATFGPRTLVSLTPLRGAGSSGRAPRAPSGWRRTPPSRCGSVPGGGTRGCRGFGPSS